MKITKITIVADPYGLDTVYLDTDLPPGIFPFKGNTSLKFQVAAGSGLEYVSKYFPGVSTALVSCGEPLRPFRLQD